MVVAPIEQRECTESLPSEGVVSGVKLKRKVYGVAALILAATDL